MGDPTPVISSITPDPWTAGTSTNFTVSGSGFGSNPGMSITGSGVQNYNFTSITDTAISGTVLLDDGATGPLTVYVQSNGWGGNAFVPTQQNGGQSQPGVSRNVQIRPAPKFSVEYVAYIPVDNVAAPTTCLYGIIPWAKIYAGDGGRGTFRVKEQLLLIPDANSASGFLQLTGETRSYGKGSPVNGPTLTSTDEDNIPNDCEKWHLALTLVPGFSHAEVYGAHSAQVRFFGQASNPLEFTANWAPFAWDVSTTVNTSNSQVPTATVIYNHTCYPAHQVKVNGQVVYSYMPSGNNIAYITSCLSGFLSHVVGQTAAVQVTGN